MGGYFEATSWLLTTATDSICPMVTIFYWLHLIQQEQDDESQDYQPKLGQNLAYRKTYDQLFFHTVNFFVVILDLMVSAKPVRLFHMIYPCLVVLGYLGCSQIYWQFSGGNALTFGVIPMLKGENPSILLLIFLEGLLLTHIGVWICSEAREGLLRVLNRYIMFQYQNVIEEKEMPEEYLKETIRDNTDSNVVII